jgi:hypothetical protein
MKGQVFLITAVIVIIVLLLLRVSLNLSSVLENKRYLESGLERLEFQNLKAELKKTLQISSAQEENITQNIDEFLRFAKSVFSSRILELNGISIECKIENVSAGETEELNITALNFLGNSLQELNLTFSYDSSTQEFTDIKDGDAVSTQFSFITSSDVNYTLMVDYKTAIETKSENITLPIEIGKSKFVGFFDLRLEGTRGEQRDKITETIILL